LFKQNGDRLLFYMDIKHTKFSHEQVRGKHYWSVEWKSLRWQHTVSVLVKTRMFVFEKLLLHNFMLWQKKTRDELL